VAKFILYFSGKRFLVYNCVAKSKLKQELDGPKHNQFYLSNGFL